MRKLALLLAILFAAASPSVAFAAKKHHHKAMTVETDPNADTSHLFRDMFKKRTDTFTAFARHHAATRAA